MLCVENVWIFPRDPHQYTRSQQQQRNQKQPQHDQQQPDHHYRRPINPEIAAKQELAEIRHAGLRHAAGDSHTYLSIYTQWEHAEYAISWCEEHYINSRAMRQAKKIRYVIAIDQACFKYI
jgi:hypothetical protein